MKAKHWLIITGILYIILGGWDTIIFAENITALFLLPLRISYLPIYLIIYNIALIVIGIINLKYCDNLDKAGLLANVSKIGVITSVITLIVLYFSNLLVDFTQPIDLMHVFKLIVAVISLIAALKSKKEIN